MKRLEGEEYIKHFALMEKAVAAAIDGISINLLLKELLERNLDAWGNGKCVVIVQNTPSSAHIAYFASEGSVSKTMMIPIQNYYKKPLTSTTVPDKLVTVMKKLGWRKVATLMELDYGQ